LLGDRIADRYGAFKDLLLKSSYSLTAQTVSHLDINAKNRYLSCFIPKSKPRIFRLLYFAEDRYAKQKAAPKPLQPQIQARDFWFVRHYFAEDRYAKQKAAPKATWPQIQARDFWFVYRYFAEDRYAKQKAAPKTTWPKIQARDFWPSGLRLRFLTALLRALFPHLQNSPKMLKFVLTISNRIVN
jgi:hypothetical protein